MRKNCRSISPVTHSDTEPFESAESLWFWFCKANEARKSGARYVAGLGSVMRPCEPLDVLAILDRLYRNRVLNIQHFRVMRHYGERQLAPDSNYPSEMRAAILWQEAFDRLAPIFEQKKLVKRPIENWVIQAQKNLYENRPSS